MGLFFYRPGRRPPTEGGTVARAPETLPALVLAAQQLEDELRRCEEAVAEAVKASLTTEKNIGRAARALKTAGEHGQQMEARVNALLAAIHGARGRAEAAASQVQTRAAEIRARMEQLQAFQARSGDISVAAKELTEFARSAQGPKDILERLAPIEERIARARQEAQAEDFDDVAHDLAGLQEMLASLRRKLEGR
jgi:chromosome segregation ATPase